LNDNLEKADLRKVALKRRVTPQHARRRMKADGFRIDGEIYLKPDRLRRWLPSPHDRTILKGTGVLRTRRDDAERRYFVVNISKLEQLLPRQ
jgi:hypothetical protein